MRQLWKRKALAKTASIVHWQITKYWSTIDRNKATKSRFTGIPQGKPACELVVVLTVNVVLSLRGGGLSQPVAQQQNFAVDLWGYPTINTVQFTGWLRPTNSVTCPQCMAIFKVQYPDA